jgi:hypothetical protein
MRFEPAAWLRDTRGLSLAAKGAWIDVLSYAFLRERRRGVLAEKKAVLAKMLGCTVLELARILRELKRSNVAGVRTRDASVTVTSRRMRREERERAAQRERNARWRRKRQARKGAGDAPVTAERRTGERSQSQSQRLTTGAPADGSGLKPAGGHNNDNGDAGDSRAGPDLTPVQRSALTLTSKSAGIAMGEVGNRFLAGHDPFRLLAWLLVVRKRAPHDEQRGGALAYFRALLKGGKEPPDWAQAGAKLLLSAGRISPAEKERLMQAAKGPVARAG